MHFAFDRMSPVIVDVEMSPTDETMPIFNIQKKNNTVPTRKKKEKKETKQAEIKCHCQS